MKIFVTGASGFTGKHFCQSASADGHEVFKSNVNLLDYLTLLEEIQQFEPDAIVHLAAISFVAHGDASQIYQVNVIGTENLLMATRACFKKPSKMLIVSSANIYGDTPNSPIAEDTPPSPVSHYAVSKLASEYICNNFKDDLDIIITRPFNYTGHGQDSKFVIAKIAEHFRNHASHIELGNLDIRREYNDVRMVCEAYLRLLDVKGHSSTVNICTGRHYSIREVFQKLECLTDHKMEILVSPDLVRPNDPKELYGDSSKLNGLVGNLPEYPLESTLRSMVFSP